VTRIAYICADLGVPIFGRKGASIHVQEVVRALTKLGAEVDLFAARIGGEPPADLERRRIHKLPRPPKGDLAERERAALAANGDLRAALEREGPFDLLYERYSLWSHAGIEYANERGIPAVLEVNAPLIEEQAEHRGLVDRTGAERVAERVFGGASEIFAVSEGIAEYLDRYAETRSRVRVVPNGVNAGRYAHPAEPSLPKTGFTVGFVGTLKPWHGLPALVEAFERLHRRYPDSRLLVVGDGPERGRLEVDLHARGLLEAAHLTGAVAPEEIPPLLAAMDAGVAPYPPAGNFYFSPLKVYEYMVAGLPVVASRVGQLAGLIRDGENGLLYPAGDTAALTDALERLRNDAGLREKLGTSARELVLERHTWEAVARRILSAAGLEPALERTPGSRGA
jgi:glycosyltransferase involved in cell wall biosynthesis